jgi:hypothetical protein
MTVGDKVVCVDDTVRPPVQIELFPNWVVEGDTYTIRTIEGSFDSEPRILVNELRNPSAYFEELGGKVEPGFSGKRFVPYEDYILSNAIGEEIEEELELLNN